MFENQMNPFQNAHIMGYRSSENIYAQQYDVAIHQFQASLRKGKIFRLQRKILKGQPYLYDLNALKPALHVRSSVYAGIQVVPIRSIIGSEGRAADFDANFYPLNEAARERWINMAMAHLSRLTLPPIQLIQIGDAYFVRDGHHRISVSRIFGQVAMDAEVVAWKASSPFPWQCSPAREPALLLERSNLSNWLG